MASKKWIGPFIALMLSLAFCNHVAVAAERSKGAYPGVFDSPVNEKPALTNDEQSKLRDDLAKTRDRQNSRATIKETAPAARSKKPQ